MSFPGGLGGGFQDVLSKLGIKDASLVKNAEQVWSMLDDLAQSDPKAYAAFIEKQKREHDELVKASAPPQSVFTLAANQASNGRNICLNFCQSDKVPAPKNDTEPIPVVVRTPPKSIHWPVISAPAVVYDIVFHPTVVARCTSEAEFKRMLIDLAFDCIEEQKEHSVKCTRRFTQHPAFPAPEPAPAPTTAAAAAAAAAASFKQSNMTAQASQQATTPMEHLFNVSVDKAPPIVNPAQASVSRLFETQAEPLIQADVLPVPIEETPAHDVALNVVERIVTVTFVLPSVESAVDIDVDPSESAVNLLVPGAYKAHVILPRKVDQQSVKAKFVKKSHTLKLTFNLL